MRKLKMGYEMLMRSGLGSTFGHDAGGSDLTAWGVENRDRLYLHDRLLVMWQVRC